MERCCCESSCAVSLPRARGPRRVANVAQWTVPGVILVLMPKCPACVAGYVALVTGVGLSVSVASYVRASAIWLCGAMLVYLAGRHASQLVGRYFTTKGAAR